MVTFSQFHTSWTKKPEAKQVTWVCGSEAVLVEEVVSTIKNSLDLKPWNYLPLVVGEDSEREIWALADQHPLDRESRLLVIRNAERLKQTDRLIDWIQNRTLNPQTYLIFVSNEDKLPRVETTEEERKRGGRGELAPHIKAFTSKGPTIECRPYTAATAKHAVTWVKSKVPMRDGIAGHLLNRCNGDLRLVRDICVKLAVFPHEITLSTINGMLTEQPRDTFEDALLALDKKTALLALRRLPVADYSRTIGMLDSKLELAGMVHDMLVQRRSPSEIARAAGSRSFLVPAILPVAKHYDSKRRLAIRKVLALADEAVSSGVSVGPLEAVVALW